MRALRYSVFGALVVAVTFAGQPAAAQTSLKSRLHASGLSLPVAFVQDSTNDAVQFVVQGPLLLRGLRAGARVVDRPHDRSVDR
jgi:hypothetical protein